MPSPQKIDRQELAATAAVFHAMRPCQNSSIKWNHFCEYLYFSGCSGKA